MGLRKPPYAFTENGVAMLSSVLRSPLAIQVNIGIQSKNQDEELVLYKMMINSKDTRSAFAACLSKK